MAKTRSLGQLTSQQLLDEHHDFRRYPPRKITVQMQKRWQRVQNELARRVGMGDTELDGIAAEQLAAEAASLISIPDVSEFKPLKLVNLKAQSLVDQRKRYEEELGELKKLYPNTLKIRNHLDRCLIEKQREALREICLNIGRELIRRREGMGQKRATPIRARRKQQSDVLQRREIVRANLRFTADQLCRRFDFDSIPVPVRFKGVTSWAAAYKDPKLRQKIHVILSKDRKHAPV